MTPENKSSLSVGKYKERYQKPESKKSKRQN